MLGAAIGIPIGQRLLPYLDPNQFKLVLGSLLVICCSAMLATAKLPQIKTAASRPTPLSACSAALMAPLSGFSGLAPALWASLRGYNKDEHRAVIQNFNLIVLSATVASNVYADRLNRSHVPQMALVAGTLVLPAIWGSKIYVGMSPVAFRKTVLWLLVFAGVTMLIAAMRSML